MRSPPKSCSGEHQLHHPPDARETRDGRREVGSLRVSRDGHAGLLAIRYHTDAGIPARFARPELQLENVALGHSHSLENVVFRQHQPLESVVLGITNSLENVVQFTSDT